jgi:hypothetical protein
LRWVWDSNMDMPNLIGGLGIEGKDIEMMRSPDAEMTMNDLQMFSEGVSRKFGWGPEDIILKKGTMLALSNTQYTVRQLSACRFYFPMESEGSVECTSLWFMSRFFKVSLAKDSTRPLGQQNLYGLGAQACSASNTFYRFTWCLQASWSTCG